MAETRRDESLVSFRLEKCSPVPGRYTSSAGKPKDVLRTRSLGRLLVCVPLRREAPSEKSYFRMFVQLGGAPAR